MPKRKIFLICCILNLFCFVMDISSVLAYEWYFSYPGTRAMGMAGAFIAQADDSSAIWYNPAGLRQKGLTIVDFTADYGEIPKTDNSGNYGKSNEPKFLSLAGYYEKWSVGISYFKPYNISINIPDIPTGSRRNTPIGIVDNSIGFVTFAAARKFGEEDSLSLGVSVDYPSESDKEKEYEGTKHMFRTSKGFRPSIGMLYNLLETDYFSARIGGVYRSGNNTEISEAYSKTAVTSLIDKYILGMPPSMGGGINISSPVLYFLLNANACYEVIEWSKVRGATDYQRTSYGGELTTSISEKYSISFRGGYSLSTPVDKNKYSEFNSTTFGVGINSEKFSIDTAYETRKIGVSSYNYFSLSLSYFY